MKIIIVIAAAIFINLALLSCVADERSLRPLRLVLDHLQLQFVLC